MACVARGLPLAIANEADNALYFSAGRNKQLVGLIQQRIRVTGTVTKSNELMKLTVPAGGDNLVAIQIDGGYKVIEI